MAGRYPLFTDEELEEALKKARGMPTKAAELLEADYVTVWKRIKANPALKDVQDSYRSRKFNHYDDLAERVVLLGLMRVAKIGDDGQIIEGQFVDEIVDTRTRLDLLKNQMNLNKGSEGIKDVIEIRGGEIKGITLVDEE